MSKSLPISPLAPASTPHLPPIRGVKLAASGFELRYKGRPDVLLALCDEGTVAAGVFTLSTSAAAPVDWCKAAMNHAPRALLVNAGQANCFVGAAGDALIDATTQSVAQLAGLNARQVLVASTGVIGQPVPHDKFVAALPKLHAQLSQDGNWLDAARAICTTDTFPKLATRTAKIGGIEVSINGFAKGSGMIAPNMATMLAFVFTDAAISQAAFQQLLSEANAKSFNCITVDGDASTNDCALAFATGKAGNAPIEQLHAPQAQAFREAFESLMIDLAQQIVRDGEGAQKFITVQVSGAQNNIAAHRMAMDIANSPLVKTAIAGEDANWGRIIMAVGKSGEVIDKHAISIAFGNHIIARGGAAIAGYDEAPVAAYMKGHEIEITVSVGAGTGVAKVWTCDLTHGYIDINADYRS